MILLVCKKKGGVFGPIGVGEVFHSLTYVSRAVQAGAIRVLSPCTEQPLGHRYSKVVEEERWRESDSVGGTEREYTGEDK